MVSLCRGAFILAQCGILEGLRATTHWLGASVLARRYPQVTVDAKVLYVDNGQILTSAGAAAGLDLCLYLARRDHGAAVAAEAAGASVMPLERAGGQSQFIVYKALLEGASLDPLLTCMLENLHRPLGLKQLAQRASSSTVSLTRHFREQTGTTPAQWFSQARVRRAQQLLETSGISMERIAESV